MWAYCLLVAAFVVSVNANVNANDIGYFLTTNQVRFRQIRSGELGTLGIDRNLDIKVISHGWIDSIDSSWYEPTKNNYLRTGRANIIAIDWSRHANGLYSTAVNRLQGVANHVADKILEFSDANNIPLSRFHLIGHSLGAHLFGLAGQRIRALRGQLVGRITGLDPAGPSFENSGANARLSPDDATFVDNIHTDGGVAGLGRSIGHIDYYPNGGTSRQNGCGILALGCSHNRAPIYFYESVISTGFVTVQCANVRDFDAGRCNNNARTVMGESVDQRLRGDFFLNTNNRSPFALGRL